MKKHIGIFFAMFAIASSAFSAQMSTKEVLVATHGAGAACDQKAKFFALMGKPLPVKKDASGKVIN